MSSAAKRMSKDIPVKTKDAMYRIDVNLAGVGCKSTYMVVTGIPEDLPEAYEDTIKRTAEGNFANALNSRCFMEFYSKGKSSKDEQPTFYNMSQMAWVEIEGIEKIK